jgi:hypothetical protein
MHHQQQITRTVIVTVHILNLARKTAKTHHNYKPVRGNTPRGPPSRYTIEPHCHSPLLTAALTCLPKKRGMNPKEHFLRSSSICERQKGRNDATRTWALQEPFVIAHKSQTQSALTSVTASAIVMGKSRLVCLFLATSTCTKREHNRIQHIQTHTI